MLAESAFEHRRADLLNQLHTSNTAQEATTACIFAIEQVACELAQNEPDELVRQRQQAIIALLKRTPQLLLCTRAQGKLICDQPQAVPAAAPSRMQLAGGAILLILAAAQLIGDQALFALLEAAGAMLLFFGGKPRANVQPQIHAEGEWAIDAEATVSRIAELMRAADICHSDLTLIAADGNLAISGEADEATLDLLLSLLESRASGRPEALMRSMEQVEQYLHALGIAAIYDADASPAHFDFLPTLGQPRVIRPALMRDGRVIRRGVAVRKETADENSGL